MTINRTTAFIITVGFIIIVFVLAAYYVSLRQADLQAAITAEVSVAETALAEAAVAAYRNEPTEVLDAVISDCRAPLRQRFDQLLNRLNQATPAELESSLPLFAACADFFADQKAVVVYELEHHLANWRRLHDLHVALGPLTTRTHATETWDRFLEQQQTLATLLRSQVELQDEIVSALIEGTPPGDAEIQALVQENRSLQETASVINQQTTNTLAELGLP